MPQMTPLPRVRRASVAIAALALGAGLTGCAEAELELGGASVKSSDASASAAPSTTASASVAPAIAADDPDLEATPVAFGQWMLRLPATWTPVAGTNRAVPGAGATAVGAGTVTVVPAGGKDQAAWLADLLAGATDIVAEREGMVEQEAITLASGQQVFHLVHSYSDNRAHLFGTVVEDQLHLLRFGLDGTPATAAVARKSVSTAVLMVPTPAVTTPAVTTPATTTPATTTPAAPSAVTPAG